jgi:hypothetical protein
MPFNTVRNYLQERYLRIKQEWQTYNKLHALYVHPPDLSDASSLRRFYSQARDRNTEHQLTVEYLHNLAQTHLGFANADKLKNEPFEFFTDLQPDQIPENRFPTNGIEILPFKYHQTNPVHATDSVPETGFQLHPLIKYLIKAKYPKYKQYVNQYIRPLGTTDATFSDFNKEQIPTNESSTERKDQCLRLVKYFLNATPFLPVHFVDCQFAKLPLHTGTGYYNRHSYKTKAHAVYAHDSAYSHRPTSKGYFLNSYLERARTLIHRIKQFAIPFDPTVLTPIQLKHRLRQFFLEYPTIMFTRNHISDRDKVLKQRPVYAVDELFLNVEVMLTFPLLTMARKMECCIMYGLETIRGGNQYLDYTARFFKSFFTIDWSHFDQSVPRPITDLYFTDFLPSLIVINHGYQPTYEYPLYPDLTPDKMFTRVNNLLHFLHTWYNNMVFVTADVTPTFASMLASLLDCSTRNILTLLSIYT